MVIYIFISSLKLQTILRAIQRCGVAMYLYSIKKCFSGCTYTSLAPFSHCYQSVLLLTITEKYEERFSAMKEPLTFPGCIRQHYDKQIKGIRGLYIVVTRCLKQRQLHSVYKSNKYVAMTFIELCWLDSVPL